MLIRALQTNNDFAIIGLALMTHIDMLLALLVLLGGLAKLHLQSAKFVQNIKELRRGIKGSLKQRKETGMLVKSFSLINAKFGSLNYIEPLTPLNCINLSNDLTVQLLLLSKH